MADWKGLLQKIEISVCESESKAKDNEAGQIKPNISDTKAV